MGAKYGFIKQDSDVFKYVHSVKKEFHPRLRDSRLLVLWRTDDDFTQVIQAMVVPPLFRYLTQADAILLVHKGQWEKRLNREQKAYHVDSALNMLFASEKYADDGRPKLSTVQPEKIGFSSVIHRHGAVTKDLQNFQTALVENQQVTLWELFAEIEPEHYSYAGYNANDTVTEKEFGAVMAMKSEDELSLFMRAARIVMEEGRATVMFLQRQLGVNFQTASILMDTLEDVGFVTPFESGKGRKVLVTSEKLEIYQASLAEKKDDEHEGDVEPHVEPHVTDGSGQADEPVLVS